MGVKQVYFVKRIIGITDYFSIICFSFYESRCIENNLQLYQIIHTSFIILVLIAFAASPIDVSALLNVSLNYLNPLLLSS